MFSSIAAKIAIGLTLVILVMGTVGYLYFNHSQTIISTLTAINARLQAAVVEQEATIAAQTEAARRQSEQSVSLQQNLADAEARRRTLENRLRRMNIEIVARANNAQAQTQVNNEAMQIFRELENITAPRDRQVSQNSQTATRPARTPQAQTRPSQTTQALPRPPQAIQPPPRPPVRSQQGVQP